MSLQQIKDSRMEELKGSGGHIDESEEDVAAFLEDVPLSYSGPAICFERDVQVLGRIHLPEDGSTEDNIG